MPTISHGIPTLANGRPTFSKDIDTPPQGRDTIAAGIHTIARGMDTLLPGRPTLPRGNLPLNRPSPPKPLHAATFDYDGDGVSNTNEWAALTDPASAASVFRSTSAVRSGGNLIITFPSVTGRTYTLWQSDVLSGAWTNTNQTPITGNGSPKSFSVPTPVPGVPKRFHRVQVGP